MFQKLIDTVRGKPKVDVRATYGSEPYRYAADVSITERAASVLDGSAKFLLREVIGLQEFRKVPKAFIPSRFVRELPITADQLVLHVRQCGLPKGFGGLEFQQESEGWSSIEFDHGPVIVGTFSSSERAHLAALIYCRTAIEPYIVGRLSVF